MKIAIVVGSLRKGSYNHMLAKEIEALAPENMHFEYADINLPLFNADNESELPKEVKALKKLIETADGVLFVTPEYNRSIPGALKNAIDWASRPYGKNSFAGKPIGTTGASIGQIGTAVAQSDLRHVLAYLDTKIMGQPEVYVSNATDIFNDKGALTSERWRENLQKYLAAFASWVEG